MNLRGSIVPLSPDVRLAAFTIDIERDFGARTGRFEVWGDAAGLDRLVRFFAGEQVPVSAFVVTALLEDEPRTLGLLRSMGAELHSHTHTHPARLANAREELRRSREVLRALAPEAPIGYRAPHGNLDAAQVEAAREAGYAFSSSIFPSYRPGVFNHLSAPLVPFRHAGGLLEIPFAALRRLRLVVSVSYLKLAGWRFYRSLMALCGLPPVVVIDSHLHDFLRTPAYHALPALPRAAWGIRRARGCDYAARLIRYLKAGGYRFVSMNEVARRVSEPGGAAT